MVAIAAMGVVLVVDVAPFWGSDVGGVLSLVPAFGVTALGLLGVRVRLTWRATAIAAGVTAGVLAALTALDLSRPADARTHLGRLAQQIADRGVAPSPTPSRARSTPTSRPGRPRSGGSRW